MKKRKKEDLLYEGREKAELDIDRMLNEGMAGGTVTSEGSNQIGHTVDLPKEKPPRSSHPYDKK